MHTCRKVYDHSLGLSCVFRQHRAKSHCQLMHGYALSFTFEFGARELDENGWVLDFGSLKPLKEQLVQAFDHRVVVAQDDPELPFFEQAADKRLINIRIVPRTGCEAFAESAWYVAQEIVHAATNGRAFVISCTCAEHGANSATYHGTQLGRL